MRRLLASILLSHMLVFAGNPDKKISIMSYNLLNLFDTVHDADKVDYEYTPWSTKVTKSADGRFIYKKEVESACGGGGNPIFCKRLDWTPERLDIKLTRMAKAMTLYKGVGADVVMVEEVENINVLNMLLAKLKTKGFKYAQLMEAKDGRGIDVGILSKLPIISSKLYMPAQDQTPITYNDENGVVVTKNAKIKRGIYRYDIQVTKTAVLTLLGNHWPSQLPSNDRVDRLLASSLLRKAMSETGNNATVALGDFNTLDSEIPNAVTQLYDIADDAHKKALTSGRKVFPGTHKYKENWNLLDKVLVKKNAAKNLALVPLIDTYQIFADRTLMSCPTATASLETCAPEKLFFLDKSGNNIPLNKVTGYSDHLPVTMEIAVQ